MSGNVYIVHAVDTEGPLYEGLDGLFSEIEEHFDISLEATQTNVELLRKKEINLGGKEELAAYFVRPDRVERYNETWAQIDKMHSTFMTPKWRQKLADSEGNPYVVSWFAWTTLASTITHDDGPWAITKFISTIRQKSKNSMLIAMGFIGIIILLVFPEMPTGWAIIIAIQKIFIMKLFPDALLTTCGFL